MKADDISLGNDRYRFHTTRWSVVLLSAQSQVPGFQAALGERARCLKRGGGVEFISMDQDAENRYRLEPVDALTPERYLPPAGPWRC